MRSMILFVFVPAFVLLVLPLLLAASFGVHPTMLLAAQLAAVAVNHLGLVFFMRDLVRRCRLAHARAGDVLGGLNPANIPKGRKLEREYMLLALEVSHCARRYPLYLASASLAYVIIVLMGWYSGNLADDPSVRAAIVAPTMLISALWLRDESRRALDALGEMDGDDGSQSD